MVATLPTAGRRSWSTADVESRHALSYWVDTICHSFLEIDIDSPHRERFHGRLDQFELGPATVSLVEADTQSIRRTPARISRSRYAGYFLLQLRSGQLRFHQYGRECHIEPGDCVLIDCKAAYRLECLCNTRSVAVRFSHDWLNNWVPGPESLAAKPIRATGGWGMALSAALATLDSEHDNDLALPPGIVAEQIAGLLALAAGPEAHALSPSEKLLNRIRGTIRDRCSDPGLTPTSVADEHGISKRYLHYLFAQKSTTFRNELIRMRLDSAHRLLSDKRYTALTIGEIAARCGFLEPSHFTRRFRKAYGAGPTEFRGAHD
ncbi:MAG: helix-turn-helix domain-containing protein [Gammaproteobacteria bacterium]